MNKMICELCYPKAVEIGEIFPGGWLMENEGKYAIMAAQGHKGHELLFFPDKPTPDPDPDCKSDSPEADKWLDKVVDWEESVKLCPGDGYFLANGCKEAGWKESTLLIWLYDRAGKMLVSRTGECEEPHSGM
jgi:hypothetical protein